MYKSNLKKILLSSAILLGFVSLSNQFNNKVNADVINRGQQISKNSSEYKLKQLKQTIKKLKALTNKGSQNNKKIHELNAKINKLQKSINSIKAFDNSKLNTQFQETPETQGIYRYTRYDMEEMLSSEDNKQFSMPNFNTNNIKNIDSAKDTIDGAEYNGQQLDVWDSWPVKDFNGNVANINGYNIVFALVGNPTGPSNGNGRIFVFYQKVSDKNQGTESWKCAGPLFNSNTDGTNQNYDVFDHQTAEWSGSAVVQNDGNIRLMYTSFSGNPSKGGYGDSRQTLSTAQVTLNADAQGVSVNHDKTTDHKPIFAGDNYYYEDVQHSTDITGFSHDNHTLRDPQLFEANGQKYLLFEGNTGPADGPLGDAALNYKKYYGGNSYFQKAQRNNMDDNLQTLGWYNLKQNAEDANGCIGLLELNNDYTVKKVLPPLVTFNLVSDELERPSIVHHDGRWYIFTSTHGWRFATFSGIYDSYLLGFSSSNLISGYKPLNMKNGGYGLVAHSNENINARNYNYSYAMIQSNNNPFLLTGYTTQLANPTVGRSTFSPTAQVNLNGQNTHIENKLLAQGQVIK